MLIMPLVVSPVSTSKVVNWSPQAMVFYDINDNTNLRVFYFGRSAQPSTNQLMPVPDNSDPLNISLGNPYLEPYFNHNIRARFGYTNKKTFTSVHANIRGGIVQDAITNAQWYDAAGAQYSMPVNGPGTANANAMIMINSPIGRSNFSIMSMTNARYNQSTSYIGTGSLDSSKYYDAENAVFNYDLFHADYPDLSDTDDFMVNKIQTMNISEMLRLTYRNDFVELIAGGRTNVSKSWYTMESANANTTWNNNVSFEMNWTLPFGMNIIGDIKDKNVILIDDMIDTAGTITNGATALKERGAKEVYACCTHAVLSGPAIESINACPISELLVLDSIPLTPDKMIDKIKVLSVAPVFAEAIKRIYGDISMSELFR